MANEDIQNHQIRPVTAEDCQVLSELAIRAKAHWGYSDEFMATCATELTLTPSDIIEKNSFYFKILVADFVAGFYSVGLADQSELLWSDGYELHALFIEPMFIGQGLGKRLFEHCLAQCQSRSIKRLFVQSDPNALDFYLKMGAKLIGEKQSLTISDRHLPMLEIII